jgi:hypothetical protein
MTSYDSRAIPTSLRSCGLDCRRRSVRLAPRDAGFISPRPPTRPDGERQLGARPEPVRPPSSRLADIAVTEETFFTEKGYYVSVANPAPATIPGNTRAAWTGNADFDELGWIPEGAVYFQYLISADAQGGGRFTAEAASDIDGDAVVSFFGYVKPSGGSGIDGRLDGSTCEGTGVFDPPSGTKKARSVPGPCDGGSGRKIF